MYCNFQISGATNCLVQDVGMVELGTYHVVQLLKQFKNTVSSLLHTELHACFLHGLLYACRDDML